MHMFMDLFVGTGPYLGVSGKQDKKNPIQVQLQKAMRSTLNEYRSDNNNHSTLVSILFFFLLFVSFQQQSSNWSCKKVFILRHILSQVHYFFWASRLAKCGSCYYCEILTVLKSRTPAAEAFRSPNIDSRLILQNNKDTCNIYEVKKPTNIIWRWD